MKKVILRLSGSRGAHVLRRRLGPCVLAAFLTAGPLLAQETERSIESEVAASLYFGNTSQSDILTRATYEQADSSYELGLNGRFTYGQARGEEGESFVNKRSWNVSSNLDYRPFGLVSPFVFGSLESSFERRIDLRSNGGVGGKVTFNREQRNRFDVSLALLAERTTPRDPALESETVARWSGRLRFRRSAENGRISLDSQSSVTPAFEEPSDFTLRSTTSLSYELTSVVRLRVTFVDTYDSRAVERGARTNNDGQLVFGIVTSF